MKKYLLTAVAALAVTAVFAQGNIIDQRKALFKEMGGASRPIGAMLKGEAPYNAETVKASLAVFNKNIKLVPSMFPAGSDVGDTTASPKIFTERAKFEALFVEFEKVAAIAMPDEAAFKANAGNVLKACGTCHEAYRIKK